MKTATLTETKNRLSALVDQVRQGVEVLILDRGRPVARLAPVTGEDSAVSEGRVARLERQGVLRRGSAARRSDLFDRPRPRPRNEASVVQVLLDERRGGR